MGESSFAVDYDGPFSLAAGIRFLEGFAPAAHDGSGAAHLDLAFCAEPDWDPVAVRVHQVGSQLLGTFSGGSNSECVAAHVARIFSLDVDGTGFATVAARDPVIAGLQNKYWGLRPVCFWTPYEAACWALIGHRTRIRQAAAMKARIAADLGHRVDIEGTELHAFPGPDRLLRLEPLPGLGGRKPEWLRGVSRAALDGHLDADLLRGMPQDEAIRHLKMIGGIGDFSAELILVRGAGEPDLVPHHEPRLARAIQLAYQLDAEPTSEQMDTITTRWAPYRAWVTLLLRTYLEETSHEISGRSCRSDSAN
jgi:DNA-3-methyladenine glycosylase II